MSKTPFKRLTYAVSFANILYKPFLPLNKFLFIKRKNTLKNDKIGYNNKWVLLAKIHL